MIYRNSNNIPFIDMTITENDFPLSLPEIVNLPKENLSKKQTKKSKGNCERV